MKVRKEIKNKLRRKQTNKVRKEERKKYERWGGGTAILPNLYNDILERDQLKTP